MGPSGRGGDAHDCRMRHGGPRYGTAMRRGVVLSISCAVVFTLAGNSATTRGPSCGRPPRALMMACSDPTIAADIDALKVAYEVAGSRSSSGNAAWLREMQTCGDDRKCLGASIAERQRSVNMARFEQPARVERRSVRVASEYRSAIPSDSREPLERPIAPARRPADQAPEVAQTAPTWYYPPSPIAPPVAPLGASTPTGTADTAMHIAGEAPPTGIGRVVGGMLLAVGAAVAIAFSMLYGKTQSPPAARCPRCHRRTLVLEAMHDAHAPFLRRRGPGRRAQEVAADRMRRSCPCGYASDAAPVAASS